MDLKFPIIEHKFSRNFPTCLDHTVVGHQEKENHGKESSSSN